uniref:Pepsin-I3 domain-containing protein n=1 Tax=Angiostrongylus costaricensis TaxID=334426 RepID=A0A0R3PGG8_ANGCS
MAEYKDNLKQAVEQHQKNLKARVAGKKMKSLEIRKLDNLPKAAKKPSSCSAEGTTQFYFDGCINNKVYVGQTYAHGLTPIKIDELKVFEKKQRVYQEHIQM